MRLLSIAAALTCAVLAAPADAATRVAVSGKPLLLYRGYSANPNCGPDGEVTVRVLTPPEHGRVNIRKARVFPRFPESNPRYVCNRRGVAGVEATYTSARGYTGPDNVALEVIFPNGLYQKGSMSIEVK